MEHFGREVRQVAVEEDEQGLDHSDIVGEAGGEGRYQTKEEAY